MARVPRAKRSAAARSDHRVERDPLGEVRVPAQAYYGVQTTRAVENFPISGQRFGRRFIEAIGLIKGAAAETNAEQGHVDPEIAKLIAAAARETECGGAFRPPGRARSSR